MSRFTVRSLATVLVLVAGLLAVGCGSNGSDDSGSSGSSGGAANDITIGYATPELETSFWVSMDYGVVEEARRLGAELLTVNAGGGDQANEQISQLQDLIQRRVDAIIVGATNGDATKAVVEQATAQGIPVVGLSSLPNTDKLASAVGADHYTMGKIQAECLAESIGGRGSVAVLGGPAGQSWADDRVKGFEETIEQRFPDLEVVAVDRKAYDRNDSVTAMEAWLQRFPELNGVYSAYDDIGSGALDAIKAANRADGVKVATSNISSTVEEALRNGELVCTSVQKIVEQGQAAVREAINAATGREVERSIVTTVVEVNRENLASTDFGPLRAPESFKP